MAQNIDHPYYVPAQHQIDGLDAIDKLVLRYDDVSRGCVILPTGSGKSYLQALVLNKFQEFVQPVKIHVIVAPRIQLAIQHLNNFRDYQKDNGLTQYRPFCLHSGGTGDKGIDGDYFLINDLTMRNINSGTSVEKIKSEYEAARCQGCDLVVFSTYHSLDRLFAAIEEINSEIDYNIAGLAQYDECQYLVTEGFGVYLSETPFEKNLFYTATRKTTADSENGLGMNNIKLWGQTVFTRLPIDMYNAGVILRPRLHILGVSGGKDRLDIDEGIVIETMRVHLEENKKFSEVLPTKLVVNTRGTEYIEHIWKGAHLRVAHPDVDIFKISSAHGAWYYNHKTKKEEKLDREDWVNRIKTVGNCIVLHYDIISEGIDVSGLTGTLIMRNSGMAKSIQMIGRVLRLCDIDRKNFKEGLISVNSPDGWIKPTGLVTVAVVGNYDGNLSSDDAEYIKELVNELRNAGFDPSEEVIIHTPRGTDEDDDIPPITGDDEKDKMKSLYDQIFDTVENLKLEDTIRVFASTRSTFGEYEFSDF